MAIVRILVDGYSLLHEWTELAPGKPRHSAAAREELIHWLTQYQDAIQTPITVFFDGANAPTGTPKAVSTPEMEILFSSRGHTADDLIERTTHRLSPFGEVLVVTNDLAERDTVTSLGALTSSCEKFIDDIHHRLQDIQEDIHRHNRKESRNYRRPSS